MTSNHEQLDRDEHHADAHARAQRDLVQWVGLAAQGREGGASVGEGVDADAVPRDRVGAGHADEAEGEDDEHLAPAGADEELEVDKDHRGDERPQDHQEAALLLEVGLAGLVDELGDLAHGLVHRQALELDVAGQAEREAAEADHEADEQQPAAVDHAADERGGAQVGQVDVRLTAAGVPAGRGRGHGAPGDGQEREEGKERGCEPAGHHESSFGSESNGAIVVHAEHYALEWMNWWSPQVVPRFGHGGRAAEVGGVHGPTGWVASDRIFARMVLSNTR